MKFLIACALTLLTFGILNILKAAFLPFANFLTFYKPVGALLGLYVISAVLFIVFLIILSIVKIKNQNFAFWFFAISAIVFFFLVFPPIIEPLAHLLGS